MATLVFKMLISWRGTESRPASAWACQSQHDSIGARAKKFWTHSNFKHLNRESVYIFLDLTLFPPRRSVPGVWLSNCLFNDRIDVWSRMSRTKFYLTVGIRKQTMAKPNIKTRACTLFTKNKFRKPWTSNKTIRVTARVELETSKQYNFKTQTENWFTDHAQKLTIWLARAHAVTPEDISFFRHTHWSQTQSCILEFFKKHNSLNNYWT